MLGNGTQLEQGGTATAEAPRSAAPQGPGAQAPLGAGAQRPLRKVAPAVDIFEKNETLYIYADVPGVGKDGVTLDVDGDVLTIRGRVEGAEAPGRATYSERVPVEYYRAFALGEDLDASRVGATLRNGVLELVLPKAERAKTKKIQIQAE